MKLPLVAAGVAVAVAVAVVASAWAFGALSGDDTPVLPMKTTAAFPEGVFRYSMARRDVLDLDATLPPAAVANSIGTFTWTLRDGAISLEQTACDCTVTGVVGSYTANVGSKRLTVRWRPTTRDGQPFCVGAECVETVGWSWDGRALHITPLEGADRRALIFWGDRKPWVRVG